MLHQAYGVMRNRAGQVGCPQLFESTRGEEKPRSFLANVVRFLRKGVRFPAVVVRVVAIARSPPRARYAHTQRVFVFLPSPHVF